MKRFFSRQALCLSILSLFFAAFPLFTASAAQREDMGWISAVLPKGWESAGDEAFASYYAPPDNDALGISIGTMLVEEPDLELLLRKRQYRSLGDGKGYIAEIDEGREWGILSPNGAYFTIGNKAAFPGLGAFINSMKPTEDSPGLVAELQAAKAKEVLDWLNFVTPPFAGGEPAKAEEEASTEERTERVLKGIAVTMPVDWKLVATADGVLASSPDGKKAASAKIVPIEAGSGDKDSEEWQNKVLDQVRRYCKSVDGKNLFQSEGMYLFDSRAGEDVLIEVDDEKPRLLIVAYKDGLGQDATYFTLERRE